MADRPDAYVRKDPGDIIRSGDWNELQIRAREEIRGHRHTGKDDGTLIPRTGIEPNAIDGSRIDPAADVAVNTLTTSGNLTVSGDLKVNGKEILGDIADLLATIKGLQSDKLNRAGDTVSGTLNIQKDLLVMGNIAVGSSNPPQERLDVNGRIKAGALTIGPWPGNPTGYVYFGTNMLDQSKEGNYALLQHSAAGVTYLNSPQTIQFRIGNVDKMVLAHDGSLNVLGPLKVSSAITPSAGNSAASGIMFPTDPGGGGADAAWIRYYARSGEACTLEIGVSNDADDHIALMPSGNVGIGTTSPAARLNVTGNILLTAPDKNIYSLNLERIDENERSHQWAFWHMNSQYGQNDLQLWEYKTDKSGKSCGGDPNDGAMCTPRLTIKEGGNVGIGTTDPKAKLAVAGEFIRKVKMATGLGPEDGTDNGQIASRVLTFTKYHADTAIRILYCDNLRVNGNDVAARWEIRVDSQSVPGGAIFQDKYGNSGNYHEPATILGYAVGISAGTHTIGVWVGAVPGRGVCDAYTGWNNSRWTLEAQEVWL